MLVAGKEVRAPFGVADTDGLLPVDRHPGGLTVSLLGPDGSAVVEPIERGPLLRGLAQGLLPAAVHGGRARHLHGADRDRRRGVEMAIKVDVAGEVPYPAGRGDAGHGDPHRCGRAGIDPICTHDPVCPLHDVTVADALEDGRPVALLVATPAFCQVDDLRPGARRAPRRDGRPSGRSVPARGGLRPSERRARREGACDRRARAHVRALSRAGRWRRTGRRAPRHDLRRGGGRRGTSRLA